MCSPPVASKHNTVVLLNRALLQWWRNVFSKSGWRYSMNFVPGTELRKHE